MKRRGDKSAVIAAASVPHGPSPAPEVSGVPQFQEETFVFTITLVVIARQPGVDFD